MENHVGRTSKAVEPGNDASKPSAGGVFFTLLAIQIGGGLIIGFGTFAVARAAPGWEGIGDLVIGGMILLCFQFLTLIGFAIYGLNKTKRQNPVFKALAVYGMLWLFCHFVYGLEYGAHTPIISHPPSSAPMVYAQPTGKIHEKPPVLTTMPASRVTEQSPASPKAASPMGRKQEIRILEVYETRNLSGSGWISAKGFALVDDGSAAYMWQSSTPPRLDITFNEVSEGTKQCLDLTKKEKIAPGKAIRIQADGIFQPVANNGVPVVGRFRLDHLMNCTLINAADSPTAEQK